MFTRLIRDLASDLATQKNISRYVGSDTTATEVWRGTKSPEGTEIFSSFGGPREMGAHVGTRGAAEQMLDEMYLGQGTLFRGITNIKNPLHFHEDLGHWDVGNVVERLVDHTGYNRAYSGIDNNVVFSSSAGKVFKSIKNKYKEEVKKLGERYNKLHKKDPDSIEKLVDLEGEELENIRVKYAKQLQKALKSEGFDSISYINSSEDAGKPSFILFDPQQFKDVGGNVGTFDKNKRSMLQGGGMFTLGLGMGEENE